MRRLWIRLLCWWYDICPEHGPMKAIGLHSRYCPDCDNLDRVAYAEKINRITREAKGLNVR